MPSPLIHAITARLNRHLAGDQQRACYCFDGEILGLVAESFVSSATEVITAMLL